MCVPQERNSVVDRMCAPAVLRDVSLLVRYPRSQTNVDQGMLDSAVEGTSMATMDLPIMLTTEFYLSII
jgi:hypothetical protein